ncbi:UDP-glucose 4-epimerase [Thermodesulfitimonas autotrophica]|uniref:UDP-glucose 4-epimerase n=1 Tax=Thermodesulfitimonas autotrophica TaxID=1894989 RepID=A0A3N5AQC0_9THEO|nr:NAD-dependent epimerase/dehydratase family protein [Thermodesulfitimonas autotrophica]RPF47229.1 UDP-glucose 4-epimerase [Thermodesulfitimonas autotrophica]
MMRVLVTGGAGFIGSHVVATLLSSGTAVAVVDNLSTGCRENLPPGVPFYQIDITTPALAEVFHVERPEVVVHLAAQAVAPRSLTDPCFDATVNITGTVNVLECGRKAGVRRVVYASSAAVYGDPAYLPVDENHPIRPLSPYGASKYAAEVYLWTYQRLYGIEGVVLRLANVYGPGQDSAGEGGVVAIFCRRLRRGEPPEIHGDGGQTRDFIYVADVAAAVVASLTRGAGEVLNISTGRATSVHDLCRLLLQAAGKELAPVYKASRPGDIRHSVLSNERAKEALLWAPRYDLPTGLRETYAAFGAPGGG